MSSRPYTAFDELKTNPDDIVIGGYYLVGGVECVVIQILNHNECLIVDLFEERERRANKSRLNKIEDPLKLESAKSSYSRYLNERQTNLTVDTKSNLTTFTLFTTDKDPQENRTEHHTCSVYDMSCQFWLTVLLIKSFVIVFFVLFFLRLYVIAFLTLFIGIIALCGGVYLFYGNKYSEKIEFDANKEMVYLYHNSSNEAHETIPYNEFSRLGWHRYVWHGARDDEWFANVYVVRKHIRKYQKPIQLNWYLTDREKADKFTREVNAFWARTQNIDHIHNEMTEEFTNFMKDNVRRHHTNFVIAPNGIIVTNTISSEHA